MGVATIYVEFSSHSNPVGDVVFSLDTTSNSFGLHARNSGGYVLTATLDNIATANNAQGSTINLSWAHNGNTPFILSGSTGAFWSNNPSPSWMQGMLPAIGKKPLRHISIPGSHDAGMSAITGGTGFTNAMNCQTQTKNIGDQLTLGARYFDLRPTIAGGDYVSGHYSDTHNSLVQWQGANGESFDDIIDQINAFTASHSELIILYASHMLNTDVGEGNYRGFTQDESDALLDKMRNINYLYSAPDPYMDISLLSLEDFIGSGNRGQPSVVVVVDSGHDLGDYLGRGFYTPSQFNVTNLYSGSDDYGTMYNDQMAKLAKYKPTQDDLPFLLSWTLTQSAEDMLKDTSILDLAAVANNKLYTDLFMYVKQQTLPNIIYVDKFDTSAITALTIAINNGYATKNLDKPQRRAMHKKRISSTVY